MGMTDEFESCLQVLRGFDVDISDEVNEIKVRHPPLLFRETERYIFFYDGHT